MNPPRTQTGHAEVESSPALVLVTAGMGREVVPPHGGFCQACLQRYPVVSQYLLHFGELHKILWPDSSFDPLTQISSSPAADLLGFAPCNGIEGP